MTARARIVRSAAGRTITRYLAEHGLTPGVDIDRKPRSKGLSYIEVSGGRRYEIGRVISQGIMGNVYEARDLNFRRTVAVKLLPRKKPFEPEDLIRFVEEAQITSQLEHPNIVPVHEMGIDVQGNVFYTMKYVRGHTLTEILMSIRRGNREIISQYPLARLLTIFQKVCDAVAFAHSRSVIHRDLKTDNVMIGGYGEVQVMDWGLAKFIGRPGAAGGEPPPGTEAPEIAPSIASIRADGDTTLRTIQGRIMGTPGFMAPEQALGADARISERSDIYSLGAILYTILALRPSVGGTNIRDMLKKIIDGKIPPPDSFNTPTGLSHCPGGQIPPALSDVAVKAMALKPEDRYRTVQELQHDIEAYQNGVLWHLVIDEDFTAEHCLSRWEVLGGQHELKKGELRIQNGEPQLLLLKRDVPGDVRVEFECRIDSVYLNDIGCFLNAIRSTNHKDIPGSGYEFKFGAHDNSLNVLNRAGQKLSCHHPPHPIVRGMTYRVMAERIGSRLRMVVNDEVVFDVMDPDPLAGTDRALVGLLGWMADSRITRVRISTLGTPWKSDILDVADRQMRKGQYSIAMELFREVTDSFPDEERLARARRGFALARDREAIARNLPEWKARIAQAWPGADVKMRLDNDGLSVEMSGAGVTDLEPLRGLPLTALSCGFNAITSLDPLRGMKLTILHISGNPVSDLGPLAGMPLRTLLCEYCRISTLEPVRGLPLEMLLCGTNRITSLEPLRGMPLTCLSVWANEVEDLSPLEGMRLGTLNVAGNRVTRLEPLRGMPLTMLHCGGNRVRDISPLKGLPLLTLHLGDNEIESLDPVQGMPLTMLSAHCNRIHSLDPLKDSRLGALTCGGNPLTGIGPLIRKPPQDFVFVCDTIPTEELEWMVQTWNADFRHVNHARNAAVEIALRHKDTAGLRRMASQFRNHRYLFIPRYLRWDDAAEFCRGLGGHLVTITSEEENEFIGSLFPGGCWFWMGLRTTEQGQEWVTGEPFEFNNFVETLQERLPGPKAFCRRWFADHVPQAHNCFMIEWDS